MALIRCTNGGAELKALTALQMTAGSVGSGVGYAKAGDYQPTSATGNPVTLNGCSLTRDGSTGYGSISADHATTVYIGSDVYHLEANTPQDIGAVTSTVAAVFIDY